MIQHQFQNSQSGYFFRSIVYSEKNYLPGDFTQHFHRNYELIRVLEGSFSLTVGTATERLHPGDWALIFPNEIHSYSFDEHFSFWIAMFSADYVSLFAKQMQNRHGTKIAFRVPAETDDLVLKNLASIKHMPVPYFRKGVLYLVTDAYYRSVPTEENASPERLLMNQLSDYIHLHYAEDVSLKTLSAALGYDYYYLSHCFTAFFNMSFTSYLNLYRAEATADDIINTDLSLTEIAAKNGFSSLRNFYYVFRKHYGTSPNEYRKRGAEIGRKVD